MLVLTRRVGEQIVIQDSIRVTIVSNERDRVRLGISAPQETRVDRQEIHQIVRNTSAMFRFKAYAARVQRLEEGTSHGKGGPPRLLRRWRRSCHVLASSTRTTL